LPIDRLGIFSIHNIITDLQWLALYLRPFLNDLTLVDYLLWLPWLIRTHFLQWLVLILWSFIGLQGYLCRAIFLALLEADIILDQKLYKLSFVIF
jgi:hypothetical protein